MRYYDTYKLVKSEDLNHHSTLFAGRMSEWFVESCFISVAKEYKHPENLVCIKVHDLKFMQPIQKGDIINIRSKIIVAGNTSITVYGNVTKNDSEKILVEGFLTFVCVDANGVKMKHNLIIDSPQNDEEKEIIKKFENIK